MKRLQGIEWFNIKPFVRLLNYSLSNNGNIRVEVQDKRNYCKYSHWLNDEEKETFKKVMSNYKRKEDKK